MQFLFLDCTECLFLSQFSVAASVIRMEDWAAAIIISCLESKLASRLFDWQKWLEILIQIESHVVCVRWNFGTTSYLFQKGCAFKFRLGEISSHPSVCLGSFNDRWEGIPKEAKDILSKKELSIYMLNIRTSQFSLAYVLCSKDIICMDSFQDLG